MITIKRGTTPTLSYTMNIPIDAAMKFRCVIGQDEFVGYLKTEVDLENGILLCTLEEDDSRLLVGGFPAWLEVSGIDTGGNAICFPKEEVYIEDADIPFPETELIEEDLDEEEDVDEMDNDFDDEFDEDVIEDDEEYEMDNDDLDNDDLTIEEYEELEPDEEG